MAKYYYSDFQKELHQVSLENQVLYKLSEKPELLNENLKQYPALSLEDFDQESANKMVDRGYDILSKLIQAAWKIFKAIWNKFIQLAKKFGQFITHCKRKSINIKNKLLLANLEAGKIVKVAKDKCDELIKQGITSDYELLDVVSKVIEATGVKSEPIDKESPAIVRQWLEGINLNGLRLNNIKGLTYTIPKEVFTFYAFHPMKEVFSKEYIDMFKNMNNYYVKLILNTRQYLSQDRYFAILREVLTGKRVIEINTLNDVILDKMIQPFFSFEQPREEGNITDANQVVLSKQTVKQLYENAHNKVNGFEAAMGVFVPAIKEGNVNAYVSYYKVETNIDHMSNYTTWLGGCIDNIATNRVHIAGRDGSTLDVGLPQESQLRRLLDDVLEKDVTNKQDISVALLEISRLFERIHTQQYGYWQELSGKQLRILDRQLVNLDKFMPVL